MVGSCHHHGGIALSPRPSGVPWSTVSVLESRLFKPLPRSAHRARLPKGTCCQEHLMYSLDDEISFFGIKQKAGEGPRH